MPFLFDLQLYNNVDGIAEPHMVHLALFMQKVMTTLSRIEAIKTNQSQRHAKSEAQLTKLQMSPKGNVMIAPVTPPSSPIGARMTSGVGSGGRAGRKALQRIAEHHTGSDDGNEVEGAGSNDRREQESHAPFRTASCDSMEIPTDAATLAIIEQQRRLEEDYLRSQNTAPGEAAASSADSSLPAPPEGFKVADPADTEEGENKFLPPSPPPSLDSSPRSMASAPVTPTGTVCSYCRLCTVSFRCRLRV